MKLILFLIVVCSTSCSTQKNTVLTRTYHQVTSRYNIYFNGRESYRSGIRKAERQYRYDFNNILPVFLYTDPEIARSVGPEMDRAINKASRIISNKSITARPARRNGLFSFRGEDFYRQSEYNRWVRQSYLLAGKAHFHKHDFIPATQTFLFITSEFSMDPVRHEARIWLARTYCERGRYHEAAMLMNEMLSDPEFPRSLQGELYSTLAHFHLKQDQYERAVMNMERALETIRGKNNRIRYTYILAQLYERTGRFDDSYEFYGKVAAMNPPYEMEFNARISRAGVAGGGRTEAGRIIAGLEKMLDDDKNRDYLDQVYYAIGNIYLRNNDQVNAIRYFEMSSRARGINSSQKSATYLALADIHFGYRDYIKAQAYYDSVLMNMNHRSDNFVQISEKSNILNDLVASISLYELEDSLQFLASMSEAERNRKVDEVMDLVRKEEADARQREQIARQSGQLRTARIPQSQQQARITQEGSWYFYNPSAIAFGQGEFETIWGDRRLEDNWRRSDRQVVINDQFVAGADEFPANDDEGEENAIAGSREYYMRNIPLTEEALGISHSRLMHALFSMGSIYKYDLEDYEMAVKAYSELLKRYPEGELSLAASYDLYLLFQLEGNNREAEHYRDIIISRYPDSHYAAILGNPGYIAEYRQRMEEAELYYENTFEYFRRNMFDIVKERTVHAMNTWPESHLYPMFRYLNILAIGSDGNLQVLRDMLKDYISSYPGTELAGNAGEFIAYIEGDYPDLMHMAGMARETEIYQPRQEGAHHFVMIVDNRQDLINRLIFNIVNFNVDHFAALDLDVHTETFSTNYNLIKVEGLPDLPVALDYFRRFSVSGEVFAGAGRSDFHSFIMSSGNYKIFLEDRNIATYMNYFEGEYLNLQ